MIKITKILFLICLVCSCQKQKETKRNTTTKNKKIKVYLLGTFHFAQTDSTYNVLDADKQESIEKLSTIIAKQKPEKIFTERQPEYEFRNKIDSLYSRYLVLTKPIKARNEIYQIGFRTAKKLGHSKIYQCDHPGQYGRFLANVRKYANKNNQIEILDGKAKGTTIRYDDTVDEDSIMNNSSLYDYVKWLNKEELMQTSHASYLTNYTQIGSTDFYNYEDDNTLIGAELTADWYKRNIMIYSKIINQLDYSENAIFLLIGADHIPIITNLFNGNPYFEVVDVKKWLE